MNSNPNILHQASSAFGGNDRSLDLGLYIHIPFCVKRCHFCAFYLVMQEENRIERFLHALEHEIAIYAAQLRGTGQRVSTVYVGGGTPTALSANHLSQVFASVRTRIFFNR